MDKLKLFGKNVSLLVKSSNQDSVELEDRQIIVKTCKKPANLLLKEFLAELLHSELLKIYEDMKKKRFEVFGNLDFEVVEKIDRKEERLAKFKGNKILVSLKAVALPKRALRYLIAHEVAHVLSKKHGESFWKVVRMVDPEYSVGKRSLERNSKFLVNLSSIAFFL